MDLPKRKNIRLNDYNYSSNGAYFITICTKNKENLLWKNVGANCVRPLDQLPLSKIGIVIENEIYKLAARNFFISSMFIPRRLA
mgnify:CR=1 FL=1